MASEAAPSGASLKTANQRELAELQRIYELYPNRDGDQRKARGFKAIAKQLKTEQDFEDFEAAVRNYKTDCDQKNKTGSEWVKQFGTFCNDIWREWVTPKSEVNLWEVDESGNMRQVNA